MPSIEDVIRSSFQELKNAQTTIASIRSSFENNEEKRGFSSLLELVQNNPGNPYVLKEALLLLQTVNDADVHDQYSLDNIEVFFKDLCAFYPSDYDLAIEYGYFLSSVQDKESEAFNVVKDLKEHFDKEVSNFYNYHKV